MFCLTFCFFFFVALFRYTFTFYMKFYNIDT